MEHLTDIIKVGKEAAIFVICLILLLMEWEDRKAKRKDQEKK